MKKTSVLVLLAAILFVGLVFVGCSNPSTPVDPTQPTGESNNPDFPADVTVTDAGLVGGTATVDYTIENTGAVDITRWFVVFRVWDSFGTKYVDVVDDVTELLAVDATSTGSGFFEPTLILGRPSLVEIISFDSQ
jgi:hypothetical protein